MGKKQEKANIDKYENKVVSIYAKENISVEWIFIKTWETRKISEDLAKKIKESRLNSLVEFK